MKTLLFTGGGGAGSEPLYALLKEKYSCHFADADPCAKPPSIPTDRWHWLPLARFDNGLTNTNFVPALRMLKHELGADLVIPGVDEELRPIAWQTSVGDGYLLPEYGFVSSHLDKLKSMRVLADAGIPVPKTARLRPNKYFRVWPEFPCVLKPREGRGSRNVAVVHFEDEGLTHIAQSGLPDVDFITQELMAGQEYTVTMVANRERRLRAIVPVRVEHKHGITTCGVTDIDAGVIRICKEIHASDPFSGVVNVQGILGSFFGVFRPFEINPRVSTTTCLAIAAGVDVFELYSEAGEGHVPFTYGLTLQRKRMGRSWQTVFS